MTDHSNVPKSGKEKLDAATRLVGMQAVRAYIELPSQLTEKECHIIVVEVAV